jgi:hypothetical protein
MSANCLHEQFESQVKINCLTDEAGTQVNGFMADIRVQRGEPFIFIAPAVGLTWDGPAVSPDGQELRAPIRPRSSFGEDIEFTSGKPA